MLHSHKNSSVRYEVDLKNVETYQMLTFSFFVTNIPDNIKFILQLSQRSI